MGCNKCLDEKEYCGTMPACFEKGLPKCPAVAVIPSMTLDTTEGLKQLSNTVVHVISNNTTYYVDDKHRITEICSESVSRDNYDFANNPERFAGQIVFDYANNIAFYYDNSGRAFEIAEDFQGAITAEANARIAADNDLQTEIDNLKNSPDVVDIVDTYADLEAYDTQHLGDNDIIRVLTDETHDGESSYYRWDKHNETWTFIGSINYTYTGGNGIDITNNEVSVKLGRGLAFDDDGNIDVSEDYIVGFDTVADMKSATNLIAGSYARTLGYYEVNDQGGATYFITDSGTADDGNVIAVGDLFAHLVIEDNTVNVRQYGCKGDNTTDDTTKFQLALDSNADVIYVPEGNYKITSKLTMPLNKTLRGTNANTCVIKVTDFDDYAIQYGQSYEYGAKRGKIEDIRIEPLVVTSSSNYTYGISLNSGCELNNVYLNHLKQGVSKPNNYIDNIILFRCHIMYCGGYANHYIVELPSNGDAIKISQCQFASGYGASNYSEYLGIRISGSTGFVLENNVINAPITLEACKGSMINNHMEGPSTNYHFNLANIRIVNSNVAIDTLYIHKCYNKPEIEIQNENPANEAHNATVSIKNMIVSLTSLMLPNYTDMSQNYNIYYGPQTVLNIENCFNQVDFSAGWAAIFPTTGLIIKDTDGFMSNFNKISSLASIKSTISYGKVYTEEMKPVAVGTSNTSLQYSASNNKVCWFESGFSGQSIFYKRVTCFDWDRKLAASTSAEKEIANIISYQSESNIGRGGIVNNVTNFNKATCGCGLVDIIYRGTTTGSYDKITKVPMCSGRALYDFGTHICGHPTESRTAGDIDTFTTVSDFKRIGDNVEFVSNSLPTVGSFTKGDKCIRSTIAAGGNIGWVYNGSTWISLGNYPS